MDGKNIYMACVCVCVSCKFVIFQFAVLLFNRLNMVNEYHEM